MVYCGAYIPDHIRRSDGPKIREMDETSRNTTMTSEEIKEAWELYQECGSFRAVGRLLGRSGTSVKTRLKQEGYV